MKYIFNLLFALCLATTLQAQQKPPYDRTTTNQVMADRGTWSRYHMSIPKGTTPGFPSYVPDSLKCGALFYRTTDTSLYVYNCITSKWDKMQKVAVSNSKLDSVAATKANLNGGNNFSGPQTFYDKIIFSDVSGTAEIKQGADALIIDLYKRNGIFLSYFGTPVLQVASTGQSADIPYIKAGANLAWVPSGTSKFYPDSCKRLVVQTFDNSNPGNKGISDTIPFSKIPALAGVYNQIQSESISIPKLVTIADMQAYTGQSNTVIVTDSLRGGTFVYYSGITKNDGGINFTATGKGSGTWVRLYNQSNGINANWWGIRADYNFKTDTYTTDNGALIETMLSSFDKKTGAFYFPANHGLAYYSSVPVKLGQDTHIFGDGGIFPIQYNKPPLAIDTLYYNTLSVFKFGHNSDGFVMDTTQNYRPQAPWIERLVVSGSGQSERKTGIKYNSNTLSTGAPDVGIAKINDVYVAYFGTSIDYANTDSYWGDRLHVSDAYLGIRMGKQQGKINDWIAFNCDTAMLDKGVGNVVKGGEVEPGASSIGIITTAAQSQYIGNRFNPCYSPFIIKNGATSLSIIDNIITNAGGNGITLDSVTSRVNLIHNQFIGVAKKCIYGRKLNGTVIELNQYLSPTGSDYAVQIDSSTNIIYRLNIDNSYSTLKRLSATNTTWLQPLEYAYPQYTSDAYMIPLFDAVAFGGTFTNPTATYLGQKMIGWEAKGYTGSGTTGPRARLYIAAAENFSTSASGTKIVAAVTRKTTNSMDRGLNITGSGMYVGDTTTVATAKIDAVGDATQAPVRIRTQASTVTTPNSGDVQNLNNQLQFYDGTRWSNLPKVLTASATLDFASTAAQSSSELTISVTGAADGDIVSIGIPNVSSNANSCYTARVSATNTVTVKFNNYSSSAIDPASGIFKVSVIK